MKHSYLEVTYRKGKALAAYYYLPRRNEDRSARTERVEADLLVDYTEDGRAIGIEIPFPSRLDPAQLNALLERLGHETLGKEDLQPIRLVG